jgi:predicted DCC family thiol-disulfide oxidoreductase YuxK
MEHATLFFDADCGFCTRWSRRAVRAAGPRLAAEPLGGEAFEAAFAGGERPPEGTLVLLEPGGRRLVRAAAVRAILRRMGGGWAALGILGAIVPGGIADRLYDAVARRRARSCGIRAANGPRPR